MKKLLYLTLIISIFVLQVKSQNAFSLIKVHNVADISQMNAIANASSGNIVYVTANSTMYQYNGSNWLAVGGSSNSWNTTGNSGINSFNNFIGTFDNNDLSIRTNNILRLTLKTGGANDHRLLFPKIVFFPASGLFNSGVIGIDGNQGRLRITAGDDDTFDNSLGASVDLHGNNAQNGFRGRLDLVAGSGATNQAINIFTGNMLRATFLSNGNFGINDPNPSQRLVVNGSAGKTGGGSWATISDRRLKRNINPYKKGLSEILKVEPVNFQYNNKSNAYDLEKTYVGVIAQEIEKILPSTVTVTKDKDLKDMRTFDSSELTWTMINAIKELNKKIEFLENEIKELKK